VTLTLRLIDALGREIQVRRGQQRSAGWHVLELDTHAVPAGFYMVIADANGRRLARPVLVTR
jgi:hypothetical protein